MSEPIDYHAKLREIATQEPAYINGFQQLVIVPRDVVQGAVLDHMKAADALTEASRVNTVLNENLQSLGLQVSELRAKLAEQRGETITLELKGSVVLADEDLNAIVDRVFARFADHHGDSEEPSWLGVADPEPETGITVCNVAGDCFKRLFTDNPARWIGLDGYPTRWTWSEMIVQFGQVKIINSDEEDEDED